MDCAIEKRMRVASNRCIVVEFELYDLDVYVSVLHFLKRLRLQTHLPEQDLITILEFTSPFDPTTRHLYWMRIR